MRPMFAGVVLATVLATSATAGDEPVRTVAKLDAKDPKYDTEGCRAARAKAIDYEEPGLMKRVVGLGGNALVPFAGTAASTAMGLQQNSKQARLSKEVAVACVSDPLNEPTPLINVPAAQQTTIPVVTATAATTPAMAAATDTAVQTVAVTQ